MADDKNLSELLVQTARLGLTGRAQDVQAYLRRVIKTVGASDTDLAHTLAELLAKAPTASAPLRDAGGPMVPVDADSRLALLKHEYPAIPEAELILDHHLKSKLDQIVAERSRLIDLESMGLSPSRSLLFVGPPGVGKTLSARWLAQKLGRPLLTLDLATVMSSFLGKTGSNIRQVLDYAKSVESVLLLDEFDAIAKRRDDDSDIGELKRLVTVMLQEIDDWPSTSLLIAATNHGELLDPAVWRRFDDVLEYDVPSRDQSIKALENAFSVARDDIKDWIPLLLKVWEGRSYSDISKSANWIRRKSMISGVDIQEALLENVSSTLKNVSAIDRKNIIGLISKTSMSDRKVHAITGFSRDTIRKYKLQNEIYDSNTIESDIHG